MTTNSGALFEAQHFLVVDDNVSVANATTLFLESQGTTVQCAYDFDQARREITGNSDTLTGVVCDYDLEHMQSGIALIDLARHCCGDQIPVVLHTGNPDLDKLAAVAQRSIPVVVKGRNGPEELIEALIAQLELS